MPPRLLLQRAAQPLTVAEIHERRKKLAEINHETYRRLYAMCTHQIMRLQDVRPPVDCCSFTVPEHILTRPPYKRHHAVRYVKEKLERYGFAVTMRDEWTLDVCWKQPKKKVKKKKPEPVVTQKKKKKKKEEPKTLAEMAAAAEQRMQRLQSLSAGRR
jgi:Family of unknown function (DUF5759)